MHKHIVLITKFLVEKKHSPKHFGQHCPAGMWLRCWGQERMGQTSWIHCVLPPWRKIGSIRKKFIPSAKYQVNVHTHTYRGNKTLKSLTKAVFANRNFCLHQAYKTCTTVLQDFLYCLQRPWIIHIFSISQTMNVVIEETVSFYLISWCGYDKTRENKIIIHEHFRMFQKVIEQFFYIILHLLCHALLGLSGTGIKCWSKMRAGVLPLCLWPQKPNKPKSLKKEHSC